MDTLKQDELFFFEQHREAYPLYEALEEELFGWVREAWDFAAEK